jgi:mannose-6-phosphate isomerase-like protein (cupin superfamily)
MNRPFKVLGIQQIAIGGADKQRLRRLWADMFGLEVTGNFRSERENVDEDICAIGSGALRVEADLMQPLDPETMKEIRCRNNWHIHHKQVQVLICVAGRGWYQEWGKEAVEMTPGTVIAIPAEVKHWHGAAKDSWFQHLTYHKDVQEGASNEWCEPVTDEVYNRLDLAKNK